MELRNWRPTEAQQTCQFHGGAILGIHFGISLREELPEIRRWGFVTHRRILGVDVSSQQAEKAGDEQEDGGGEEGHVVILEASAVSVGIQELRHRSDCGGGKDLKHGMEWRNDNGCE